MIKDEDELGGKGYSNDATLDKNFYSEENGPSLSDGERDSATAAKFYRHEINGLKLKLNRYENKLDEFNKAKVEIATLKEQKTALSRDLFEKRKTEALQKLIGMISGVLIGIWNIIENPNLSLLVIVLGIALLVFSLIPSFLVYKDKNNKEQV